MGTRWVYRRPTFRVAKPKIPLGRPGVPSLVRKPKFLIRRRIRLRRRAVLILSVTANQAVSMPIVRALRRARRTRFAIKQPKRSIPKAPFTGKAGVFKRALRFIERARAQMRARLRWKPREIPPEVVPPTGVHSNPRGTIYSAGAEMGDVYSAGSKRGKVLSG